MLSPLIFVTASVNHNDVTTLSPVLSSTVLVIVKTFMCYFVYGIINELPQLYDNPNKQSHLSSGRMVFGGSTKIMGLYHQQDPSTCPIGKIEFFIFMKDNSYSIEKLLGSSATTNIWPHIATFKMLVE